MCESSSKIIVTFSKKIKPILLLSTYFYYADTDLRIPFTTRIQNHVKYLR